MKAYETDCNFGKVYGMSAPLNYRKKPVVISAMHLTDETRQDVTSWIIDGGGDVEVLSPYIVRQGGIDSTHAFQVKTLEGWLWARYNDYIIKGVQGEFYPCKPDIFAATYEEA
jgi:hypothetical protein